MGARRIGEYRESKTEAATRFRRAFFLVSRALRSLERPESCARPPARGCPLPFTTPRSVSGYLCRSLSCKPFPFCFTHPHLPRIAHPCVRPCLVIPLYAMPRRTTTARRTVSSPLCLISSDHKILRATAIAYFHAAELSFGLSIFSFLSMCSFSTCLPFSFRCTLDLLKLFSNYSPF